TAGQTLNAGTTSVSLYSSTSSGAGCTATATLSLTGATTLGSGNLTVNPTSTTLKTWSFTTSAVTFATGDRLALKLFYNTAKACNSTTLHYDAPGVASSITTPTMP